MPRSLVYKRGSGGGAGEVAFNMTPLIDCTFQLIIFFILASQMASESLTPLQLHLPLRSRAIRGPKAPSRVIVNVICTADPHETDGTAAASHYEIDGVRIDLDDTARLQREFARRKAKSAAPGFAVEIRADKRVDYGSVFAVITAARRADIPKMNVTALLEAPQ
ncbi:MAG: biopolymer transporter ExbD [Phycisphaerae bacterium]|nr:biopolymer transporter ExbD [Phycisphaerae bacterium]